VKAEQRERITKLHLLNNLFPLLTGEDLFQAQQIQSAINYSLTGDTEKAPDDEQFNQALIKLLEKYLTKNADFGFYYWDAAQNEFPYDPLFAREAVIKGFKALAGYRKGMFVIAGLRSAVQGKRKQFNNKLEREYEEAVEFLRELAGQWTTASADLTLLFI